MKFKVIILILNIWFYQFNTTLAGVKFEKVTASAETHVHIFAMQPKERFAVESLEHPKSFELTKDYFCLNIFLFPLLLNKLQLIPS